MCDDIEENGMNALDILKNQKQNNGAYSKPISNLYEFYLTGEIESPENYVDWFDTIRHASEHDIVKIYINSYGGDLFTAIQFLRVMTESSAVKIVSVEGACMSAATMIFLAADQFEVTPHSVFMFHNYSGGTIGKGGEMIDQLLHERKWSEKLLEDIYDGFLSKDEIKAMLDNKDIWMDGEEVVRRVNEMIEAKRAAAEGLVKKKPARKSAAKKSAPKTSVQ
jgi:ATP-dependent protease ClpP protease subunit